MQILRTEYISKSFGGTKALSEVCFDLEESEVHGLVGQNGAGKSTLSRILYGDLLSDSSRIYLYDKKINIRDTRDAGQMVLYDI